MRIYIRSTAHTRTDSARGGSQPSTAPYGAGMGGEKRGVAASSGPNKGQPVIQSFSQSVSQGSSHQGAQGQGTGQGMAGLGEGVGREGKARRGKARQGRARGGRPSRLPA
ncbi:hypothetical protein VFPFJ_08570 [Purpureocillium lilacinum]|uniref:Uncharacterized protein n=1 Tax=Purpureocillium lilacinum TaxID=33203 RepID=A0A179GXT0_PURLI|nr:hypothetical protein VFPFJ_08570 [Purpureocillium lilacinum]OAQ82767.1 hypothetical protein VFPFJ_08570 [Purpureocillium lilacinum]